MSSKQEKARSFLQPGSDLVGSTGGALIGAVIGGPPGAVAGVAIGTVLKTAVFDMVDRTLSFNEKRRVGTALLYAAEFVEQAMKEGSQPRTDDWFAKKPSGRSTADEIAEGVLLAAQRTHEENKIRHQGYMIGWFAFNDSISQSTANWLIRTAADLSWSQYVMLAILKNPHFRNQLPQVDQGASDNTWKSWTAHQEFGDLGFGARELIGGELPDDEREAYEKREEAASTTFKTRMPAPLESRIDRHRLRNGGVLLHSALSLDKISPAALLIGIDELKN